MRLGFFVLSTLVSCASVPHAKNIMFVTLEPSPTGRVSEGHNAECFVWAAPKQNVFQQHLSSTDSVKTYHGLKLEQNRYFVLNGWLDCYAIEKTYGDANR